MKSRRDCPRSSVRGAWAAICLTVSVFAAAESADAAHATHAVQGARTLAESATRAEHQGAAVDIAQADGAAAEAPRSAEMDSVDLATLMAAFSEMPGLEATFEEEKHIGLLAAPLRSTGRLYFSRPGRLARFVDTPRPSSVLITPEAVHFSDDTGSQVITLTGRPELSALVESMVWLLSGNAEALSTAYAPTMVGSVEAWTLTLTPREAPLSHLIAEMVVRGSGFAVQEIRVVETSGDETRTRILEADPAREFTDEERQRLFEPGNP